MSNQMTDGTRWLPTHAPSLPPSLPSSLPPSFLPHLQMRQVSDDLSIELDQAGQSLLVAFVHLWEKGEGGREGGREIGRNCVSRCYSKGGEGGREGGREGGNVPWG